MFREKKTRLNKVVVGKPCSEKKKMQEKRGLSFYCDTPLDVLGGSGPG